jgi:hypothetical protein
MVETKYKAALIKGMRGWSAIACMGLLAACGPESLNTESSETEDLSVSKQGIVAGRFIDLGNGRSMHLHYAGLADTRIQNQLVRLIDNQVGGTIKIVMFMLGPTVRSALSNAHDRGVTVEIVHDGKNYNAALTENSALKNKIGSGYKYCLDNLNHSCLHLDPNNDDSKVHAKYATFTNTRYDSTKSYANAVFVTTANFNDGGSGTDMFNNSQTYYNVGTLKTKLDEYVYHMRYNNSVAPGRTTDYQDNIVNGRGHVKDVDHGVNAWYGNEATQNIFTGVLDWFDGVSPPTTEAAPYNMCWVRVSQGAIYAATNVHLELARLQASGCNVYVTLNEVVEQSVVDYMKANGITVRLAANKIHEKSYGIYARYKNTTTPFWGYWVWSGSRQFTVGALRANDEISTMTGGTAAWAKTMVDDWYWHYGDVWSIATPL